jgi:DNA ligase-1
VCSNQEKWPGQTFNIGTGFDDFTRANIWAKRDEFNGRSVKFKFQAIGTVDKPRIPVFLGFRHAEDAA